MRLSPRHVPLFAAALVVTACTTRSTTSTTVTGSPVMTQMPAPEPAFDPAGRWSVSLVAQGQPMDLTLILVKTEAAGTYTGNFTHEALGPMPLSSAKLDGKKMVLTLAVPTGDMATMNLLFDGDVVTGEWSMPGDGSKVSGRRL